MRRSFVFSMRALAMVAVCGSTGALAAHQPDKPSALPVQPEPIPSADMAAWRQAYEKAGRPVIAVFCGWSTGEHQARSPEDTILNQDPSSLTMRLREAIQLELDDPQADPEFIDLNATRAATERLKGTFDLRRDREAAKLLGVEAGANLVILVSLEGDSSRGRPTGGSLSVIDANRGRSAGRPIPFEWVYETDLVGVRSMAKRLTERLVEDLSARARPARPYTVRLYGDAASDSRAVASLRRHLLAIAGVDGVRPGQTVSGRRDAARELTITTNLDPLDLEVSMADALASIGYATEPVKTEGDALVFRTRVGEVVQDKPVASGPWTAPTTTPATPTPEVETPRATTPAVTTVSPRRVEPTREDCEIDLLDPDSVDGLTLRQQLHARYAANGSPTVAVIINRAPLSREMQRAMDRARETGSSPEQVIIWQNATQGVNAAAVSGNGDRGGTGDFTTEEFETLNTLGIHSQTLESLLYERLGTGTIDSAGLGFKLVDAASVRERLKTAIATSASPLAERELIDAIRKANIADLVIVGRAALERDGNKTLAFYDFRLVGKGDALLASATGLSSELSVSKGLGAVEDLADIAVSRLGCGLRETWNRENATTTGGEPARGIGDAEPRTEGAR